MRLRIQIGGRFLGGKTLVRICALAVALVLQGNSVANAQSTPSAPPQTDADTERLREAMRKKMAETQTAPVVEAKPVVETNVTAAAEADTGFKPLAPGEYNNWLEVGIGNYFVSDDKAQFQQRMRSKSGMFGGIEDFHWETPVDKKGLFSVDGRAIYDNNDYALTLGLTHPDYGFVRGGYREFRTWYDGSGGFFPPNGRWFDIFDDDLELDRREAWIEAGLILPDLPQILFRYSHQERDGKKGSTVWGDSNLTAGLGTRGIVPAFWDIDEKRDIFELDVKHTIGVTDFGVGGRLDLLEQDNSRNERRRPGETGTTVAGPGTSIDRYVTQNDKLDADLANVHGFSESRLSDRVWLTLGGSFTTMDTDISGSRIYGADYDSMYDPNFVRRQQRDEGFFDLGGGALWKQTVGNVNLMWMPFDHLTIVPSFRVEHVNQDGKAAFTETEVLAGPTFITAEENFVNYSERGFTDVSEQLEMRYTGLTNWVLYVRGEWLQGDGYQEETQAETDLPPPSVTIYRDTDSRRFTQKYVAGINWYPLRRVNFATQYYHKERENDYSHDLDSTPNNAGSGNRYPAFLRAQDFETDDVNFRVSWRPCNYFSAVSRYDFQRSKIRTKGDQLSTEESGDMVSHIFSQGFTVSPVHWMYLQCNGTYAWDETDTPATSIGGASTHLVTKSRNGYWNASALMGISLDDRTELQTQYSFYNADNYNDNSLVSTAYGAEAREHGVTVTLSRWITPRLRWSLKYGFFDYDDATSGGHDSYTAHMVYTGVQYRF